MDQAEKISITLTSEMVRTIRASIESGEYASTSEVLRDAMRVWQRRRREDAEQLAAIRARIRQSLDDPRPDLSIDEVDARLDALFSGRPAKRRKPRRNAKA
jgi:antitoxin ParD1/3/4